MAYQSEDAGFWIALDELISACEIKIDRPKGSHHPDWPELVYPLDYGYLEGSVAVDGNEIDIWLGSLPTRQLVAIAVTVDAYKRDSEVKLLIACTEDELSIISEFHNSGCQSAILIRRDTGETEK